jgi:predicted PurR-regulated permease PerM
LLICRHAPVSTLALFVGAIGGTSAFGIIGVIIAPVLLPVTAALLRLVDETPSRPAGHPWLVQNYALRQAGPTMLKPVDHRAGLA